MLDMSDLAKEFVEFFDCEYEYFPNNTYEEIMEKLKKYSKEGNLLKSEYKSQQKY